MIVALLTDFGTRDYFVGAVKGVLLSRAPGAILVDITHEIRPQDVEEAAFLLAACYRNFPTGAVFLVVVDPGVGSSRRAIVAGAGGYLFVGPDNGVFSYVLERESDAWLRRIEARAASASPASPTFHGRDLFAPVAAMLAIGADPGQLGPILTDPVRLTPSSDVQLGTDGTVRGRVLHIDRFGNCVTNLRPGNFPEGGWREYGCRVGARLVTESREYYSESYGSGPFMIVGSAGYLEISIAGGSAAADLAVRVGSPVVAIPHGHVG
jgi:S-adenosyl-L-methionine hydrolase (adenosine-forming)